MSDYYSFLISILYHEHERILRCALKVHRDHLTGDCAAYPMEPGNKEQLHRLLPEHVRSCGPIVGVDEIFEVEILSEER